MCNTSISYDLGAIRYYNPFNTSPYITQTSTGMIQVGYIVNENDTTNIHPCWYICSSTSATTSIHDEFKEFLEDIKAKIAMHKRYIRKIWGKTVYPLTKYMKPIRPREYLDRWKKRYIKSEKFAGYL